MFTLKRCLLIFNPCPILAYLALHAEIQSKNRGVVKANPGRYRWKFENLNLEQWLVFLWKLWSHTCMRRHTKALADLFLNKSKYMEWASITITSGIPWGYRLQISLHIRSPAFSKMGEGVWSKLWSSQIWRFPKWGRGVFRVNFGHLKSEVFQNGGGGLGFLVWNSRKGLSGKFGQKFTVWWMCTGMCLCITDSLSHVETKKQGLAPLPGWCILPVVGLR